MIVLRSTVACTNTPRVALVLEELGLAYRIERAPDGTFLRGWGSTGPLMVDGDLELIEFGAVLRHLVRREGGRLWPRALADQAAADRWLEFQTRRLTRALDKGDPAEIARLWSFVERRLGEQPWLGGDALSVADLVYAREARPAVRATLAVDGLPRVAAFLERLAARPAFARTILAGA